MLLGGLGGTVAASPGAPAQGQDTEPGPPLEPQAGSGRTQGPPIELEETTVVAETTGAGDLRQSVDTTAVGVPARTDQLPLSVTNIPLRVIDDQQAFRLEDIFRNSPSVQESPTKGNTQSVHLPFIRGFQTGGVYRNGLFMHQNGANINTANIERVEILKGPQSVLYGLMQPGGVVNYITKSPTVERFGEVRAIFDEHGRQELRTDVGGALDAEGNVRFRFNSALYDSDLFTDEEFARGYFLAPELSWDINEQTTLDVSTSYLDEDRLEQGFVGLRQSSGRPAWDPETFIGARGLPGKDQQELVTTATLTHQATDNVRVRLQGGYHEYDLDQLESFAGVFGGVPDSGEIDIGIQRVQQEGSGWLWRGDVLWEVETGPAKHSVTLGTDFNEHSQDRFQAVQADFFGTVNVFDPDLPSAMDFAPDAFPRSESSREWTGIYVQDLVSLWDDEVHLLGNLRFDRVDQTSVNFAGNTSRIDAEDLTARLGVLWNATEWMAPYASWSESFVPTSATTVAGDLLDPEQGSQIEAGFKFDLVEERLDLTVSAFQIDREDVPIDDPNTDEPGSVNGGEFRSEGFEVELVGRITDNLQVIAGYGSLEAEVLRSSSLEPGDRIQGVPEQTANLWLAYDFGPGPLEGLGLGGGLFYRSDIVTQFSQFVGDVTVDGYVTSDLSAWYRTELVEGTDLRVGLTMMNVFDEEYVVGGFGNGGQFGQPRTLIGSIGIRMSF